MKGIRVNTLMLLICIAAMGMAWAMQNRRAGYREIELNERIRKLEKTQADMRAVIREYRDELSKARAASVTDGAATDGK